MTCISFNGNGVKGFICGSFAPYHRPRLADGSRVFMEWHNYLGPTFYRDSEGYRIYEDWYDNPLVVDQLKWFCSRGHRS